MEGETGLFLEEGFCEKMAKTDNLENGSEKSPLMQACSGGEIRSTTLFLWSREGAEYILPEDTG